ncbi:hypothetical protein DL765_007266 [Monosporascus sp. GIB2]|nr:hypothetical protein DL765_007266 [Monosporascus sp. GIB2]
MMYHSILFTMVGVVPLAAAAPTPQRNTDAIGADGDFRGSVEIGGFDCSGVGQGLVISCQDGIGNTFFADERFSFEEIATALQAAGVDASAADVEANGQTAGGLGRQAEEEANQGADFRGSVEIGGFDCSGVGQGLVISCQDGIGNTFFADERFSFEEIATALQAAGVDASAADVEANADDVFSAEEIAAAIEASIAAGEGSFE